jgi:predicted RNA-binding protein with PUA-like domain
MAYWLVKSEPSVWSWAQQQAAGATPWNGVRSGQALIYMRAMKKGDLAYFYHSNEGKEIVGVVSITREYYPDADDAKSGLVDVTAVRTLPAAVTLADIKATPALVHLALVRQSRLSVMPIDEAAWRLIDEMAKVRPIPDQIESLRD